MKEKEYATSKIHMDQCWKCSSIFLDSEEHEAINRYLTSLESPDVAKAEEEKFEKLYQEKLVEMAEKMLAEMNGSR